MMRSVQIARFAGIPVKIHWTFGLLVLWILYVAIDAGLDLTGVLLSVGFVMVLFLCVLLHEYGHALTALRFGVKTRDIILSPIGGIARLTHIPEVPRQEMIIAIAGPLVNLAIAVLLLSVLGVTVGLPSWSVIVDLFAIDVPQPLLLILVKLNLILLLFNLIPAFPMDGGRVLRAFLAQYHPRARATLIASYVGRACAAGFIAFGIIDSELILALIGVFVFVAAGREGAMAKTLEKLSGMTAGQAARDIGKFYQADQLFDEVVMQRKGEQDFLVLESNGSVCGVLFYEMFRPDIAKNLSGKSLREVASRHFEYIPEDQTMDVVFRLFGRNGYRLVPVTNGDGISGVIDREIIEKVMRN
jgi:Zn-dependent protease